MAREAFNREDTIESLYEYIGGPAVREPPRSKVNGFRSIAFATALRHQSSTRMFPSESAQLIAGHAASTAGSEFSAARLGLQRVDRFLGLRGEDLGR